MHDSDQTAGPDPVPTEPLTYGCPDCGGVLVALPGSDGLRFRCRVGHEFDADGLLRAQGTELEDALWTAVRGLEEQAELSGRIADAQRDLGQGDRHRAHARDSRRQAAVIRRFLVGDHIGETPDDLEAAG